jgi:chromatin segregation and condensation protein Rec8/ScpA/Scc1 (kleisin family)
LFLAVLELTKARTILPEQELPFDDIWLSLQPLPS